MIVSGRACRDVGLVTAALDLSLWSWAFGPASFLMSNYDCFRTCMWGHWTCHCSTGLVILKLGLRPSFVLNIKSWLFPDLHVGTLDLSPQRWTCHYEAGPSAQLHSQYQIMSVSGLACRDFGLVTAALDLSLWSWAFGQASFLISNYDCFRTCMSARWTCHRSIGLVIMKLGLRPSFILNIKLWLFLDLHVGTLDLSPQRWICHYEAGPSAQLHS